MSHIFLVMTMEAITGSLLHCSSLVEVVLPVPNTYHRHIHHPHRPHSLLLRKSQPKSVYCPELEAILMLGGSTYEVIRALHGLPKQLYRQCDSFLPNIWLMGHFSKKRKFEQPFKDAYAWHFKSPL